MVINLHIPSLQTESIFKIHYRYILYSCKATYLIEKLPPVNLPESGSMGFNLRHTSLTPFPPFLNSYLQPTTLTNSCS